MNVSESLRLAASSLNTNKLRSFLTLLGIIIGIMAVIIIMTLGRGLERQTLSELEGVGTSTHYVIVHERPDEEALDEDPFAAFNYGQPTQERDAMTFDQLDQLKAYFGDRVQAVDIEAEGYGDVTYGDITASTSVYPVLTGSLGVRGLDVEYGRGITDADIAGQRPVAVVSDEFVQALFDSDPRAALGQRFGVTVSGQPAVFTVVGVLAPTTPAA
ncbi:ABC transporter permease [Corynebacterium aquatimens]|uniref:ABC transporter permease n=1 Tax=Corynebacterium aquatimens TaxID=1190508 RepID=UPI002540FF32|nr:ABC transporter permease [Corynebacterium aquatimens]